MAVLLALTAAGVGAWLAALDVRYVPPVFSQLGMFATPAVNPLTSLIEAFRAGLVGGQVRWAGVAAVVLFVSGCPHFRRAEDRLADVI